MKTDNSLFKINYSISNTNSSLTFVYHNSSVWNIRSLLLSLDEPDISLEQSELRFQYIDKKLNNFAVQLKSEISSFSTIISNYQRREQNLLYEDINRLETRFHSISYPKEGYLITASSVELVDSLRS